MKKIITPVYKIQGEVYVLKSSYDQAMSKREAQLAIERRVNEVLGALEEQAYAAILQVAQYTQMDLGYWEMARRCPLLVGYLSRDNEDKRKAAQEKVKEIRKGAR